MANCLRGQALEATRIRQPYEILAALERQSILGRPLKGQQRSACLYVLISRPNVVHDSLQEKERIEKKAAKAEKEKKIKESQEKARSMMASFFGKPKASSATTSPSKGPTSNTLSDFDRVFRPFTLKKGAELAPTHWFQEAKRRKRNADVEVIVIDEDDTGDHDVEMCEPEPSPSTSPGGNIFFSCQDVRCSSK